MRMQSDVGQGLTMYAPTCTSRHARATACHHLHYAAQEAFQDSYRSAWPQTWPQSGQIWSSSGRIWAIPRATLVELEPHSADCGAIVVDAGADFGPEARGVAQKSAPSGAQSSELGKNWCDLHEEEAG